MKTKLELAVLGTMVALALPVAAHAQQWDGNQGRDPYHQDQDRRDQYRPDQDNRDRPQYRPNEFWQRHPGYLRALSDLRTALALVQHQSPTDQAQANEEYQAANEITAAYNELQQAAVDDGRNLNDQPPPDFTWGDHRSRLQQANELLVRASHEIRGEEENPAADGMRDRAIRHIGGASHWIQLAERYWHF